MKRYDYYLSVLFLFLSLHLSSQDFEIYVSDAGNFINGPWKILKYDQHGQNPQIFTEEQLGWPQDILFLEDQDVVLISNFTTNRINRHNINTGEYIDIFASGIIGATRMKIGPDGLLYVLQWDGNGRVRRYELDGTFVDEFTDFGVDDSIGLDWDADGNLYVSSYSLDYVRRFNSSGENQGLFISSNLVGPTNIYFDDNGDMVVLDYDGGAIRKYDSQGQFIRTMASGLSEIEGVDFLPNGNMLVGNGGNGSVKEFTPDGSFVKDFVTPRLGGLIRPNAVVRRDLTVTSTDDHTRQAEVVSPSTGRTFYLVDQNSDYDQVLIFNMSGQQIKNSKPGNGPIWEATGFPEGVYQVVATDYSGKRFVQRVIVQDHK